MRLRRSCNPFQRSFMRAHVALVTAVIFTIYPDGAQAYIGPGAGFAFLGSGFVFILTLGLIISTILFWPIAWLSRKVRGKGISRTARASRVVIVGLDGLDAKLTEQFIDAGLLPNLKSLKEKGSYSRLATTLPAISPVAWSTFQTGVNPGLHNIFDFLTRDKRFCMPMLSSTVTEEPLRKFKIGRFEWTFGRSKVRLLRKSQPFWKILGEKGIFSNILRVPISYPPEPFFGNILSAMCTPDLRGTQGTFTFYTTEALSSSQYGDGTGGEVRKFSFANGSYHGVIQGPSEPKSGRTITVPFSLSVFEDQKGAVLKVQGQEVNLTLNESSPWVQVNFHFGRLKKISGICRFCLREAGDAVSLYISPINVSPDKPVLPIAHPIFFSTWLTKKQGLFGTLGLMEDTWGRNEGALDDQRFLDQTYLTHEERKQMFFNALEKTREGLCVCVFDASDRIQHMFWRYQDQGHPAPLEKGADFSGVIREMYQKMDELVGETRAKMSDKDVLIVLSDHGFSSFRRGINLNTWLYENGYLALKEGITGADFLKDVDWSRTKAFAVGLAGIYLNRKGRERCGIVEEKDVLSIKSEISKGLRALKDPQSEEAAVREVYDTSRSYRGLYSDEAPDLIVGYAPGYRVSWGSVTGTIEQAVFSDNVKAWSGDHHIDPKEVPGILFSSVSMKAEKPHIVDLAPTVLNLFGVPAPVYMEGKLLF